MNDRCSPATEHPRVPVDAIVNLVNHQQQCDMDGVMVQVSRKALAEVLVYVTEVRPDNKWADMARAPSPSSAASEQEALDNSQSLLVMIQHLGVMSEWKGISKMTWEEEGLTKLLAEQITENRTALIGDVTQGKGDPLVGLAERLDRLLLTSTGHERFVLATESARNIVEIVREWIRTGAGYSVSSTESKS